MITLVQILGCVVIALFGAYLIFSGAFALLGTMVPTSGYESYMYIFGFAAGTLTILISFFTILSLALGLGLMNFFTALGLVILIISTPVWLKTYHRDRASLSKALLITLVGILIIWGSYYL